MPGERVDPRVVMEVSLDAPVAQMRAAPVQCSPGGEECLLLAYSAQPGIDPYFRYFDFPSDTLKLALVSLAGELLWRRDLGPGVVPGVWFCPIFPFDLDGDGVDEVYFVNNLNPKKPLDSTQYVLERLDSRSGETTGQWKWPHANLPAILPISHAYRNFIFGGYARGTPVLVTAQGTYSDMYLQGWSGAGDMVQRWALDIPRNAPGARGSHTTAVLDWNGDGVDEVFWGERCIELDGGKELFCADRETYGGHSDLAQPVYDRHEQRWRLYTIRENERTVPPRVCVYDQEGRRLWGRLESGHIHTGWVARIGPEGEHVGLAVPDGTKSPGVGAPRAPEEYYFDIRTGEAFEQEVSLMRARPVDIDGDGRHEFAGEGIVLDRTGTRLAEYDGRAVLIGRLFDAPGEHLLTWDRSGLVRGYVNTRANHTAEASRRYANPLYKANRKMAACGYNHNTLAGA